MTTQRERLIMRILAGGAVALGFCVGAPPPAGADPDPYGGLHGNPQEPAPAGSADPAQEIQRGLREGRSALVPGLPAPARQPQQ